MEDMDTAQPSGEKQPVELFSNSGIRLDGRALEEFRRVCKLSSM
jgi:exosome complex RNA-binding protein Rrp42 (RNase PH superfamily)